MKTFKSLASVMSLCAIGVALLACPSTALAAKASPNPYAGAYCGNVGTPEFVAVANLKLDIFNSGKVTGTWGGEDKYSHRTISGEVSTSGVMQLTFKIVYPNGFWGIPHRYTITFQGSALVEMDADGNLVGLFQWDNGGETYPLFLHQCN